MRVDPDVRKYHFNVDPSQAKKLFRRILSGDLKEPLRYAWQG